MGTQGSSSGVESKSKQNRSGLYEKDFVITVQEAEAETRDEAETGGGGNLLQNKRCYNCNQPNFTREHLDRCPAKGATCNFCRKIGHIERTCRGKRGNQRGRVAVGMVRENADDRHLENSEDEEASQHASSIGWVNKNPVVHSWNSSSSDGNYMVMAIKNKRFTELKVAGAQLLIRSNGKSARVWLDSGSPISIFTIG